METFVRRRTATKECDPEGRFSGHIVERAESDITPDVHAQLHVGWRSPPREPKRPFDVIGRSVASQGKRFARVDFAERVREYLDLGADEIER